jgi:hypothetical protein
MVCHVLFVDKSNPNSGEHPRMFDAQRPQLLPLLVQPDCLRSATNQRNVMVAVFPRNSRRFHPLDKHSQFL